MTLSRIYISGKGVPVIRARGNQMHYADGTLKKAALTVAKIKIPEPFEWVIISFVSQ